MNLDQSVKLSNHFESTYKKMSARLRTNPDTDRKDLVILRNLNDFANQHACILVRKCLNDLLYEIFRNILCLMRILSEPEIKVLCLLFQKLD